MDVCSRMSSEIDSWCWPALACATSRVDSFLHRGRFTVGLGASGKAVYSAMAASCPASCKAQERKMALAVQAYNSPAFGRLN